MTHRELDRFDYLVVAAISWLAYGNWDGRHALHARLLSIVTQSRTITQLLESFAGRVEPHYYLVIFLALGAVFLLVIVEVLPHINMADSRDTADRK